MHLILDATRRTIMSRLILNYHARESYLEPKRSVYPAATQRKTTRLHEEILSPVIPVISPSLLSLSLYRSSGRHVSPICRDGRAGELWGRLPGASAIATQPLVHRTHHHVSQSRGTMSTSSVAAGMRWSCVLMMSAKKVRAASIPFFFSYRALPTESPRIQSRTIPTIPISLSNAFFVHITKTSEIKPCRGEGNKNS